MLEINEDAHELTCASLCFIGRFQIISFPITNYQQSLASSP
jgi:hypothetical protein